MPELSPLAKKYKDALDGHMIVFDMDGTGKTRKLLVGTLWWFWLDTHVNSPIKRDGLGFKDR